MIARPQIPVGLLAALVTASCAAAPARPRVVVASKRFTESIILGEIMTQLASAAGADARHQQQLGGTRILWNALLRGEIDAYPEYTGTLRHEILAGADVADDEQLSQHLRRQGLLLSRPLGFNNTYAIGMRRSDAERLAVRRISDLAHHATMRFGFSSEFLDRRDGWVGLRREYGLPQRGVRGLDHDLAYRGLQSGDLEVIDLYSTDAEIVHYDLAVLEDDRRFFPDYHAVLVMRAELAERAPEVLGLWQRLEGAISRDAMIEMNGRAKLDRMPATRVAARFVTAELAISVDPVDVTMLARLLRRTREHLILVGISLAAAIVVGIPLGTAAAKLPRIGQAMLAVVGVIQTIPSLALLVFMIPLIGIGEAPAVVAMFLYSLLPIVRNTHAGLHDIPMSIHESALALGLPAGARLRLIELPMASRSILAGVKTSAVINVGTATLGALVGAGGYGQPILTGIRLDDTRLILLGAVPAALMALLFQALFELAERRLVPRGLRLMRTS